MDEVLSSYYFFMFLMIRRNMSCPLLKYFIKIMLMLEVNTYILKVVTYQNSFESQLVLT